jgi:hypothetical protein
MADTSDTRSRPSTPQERREGQGTARTPRLMRRDLFDLPSNRLFRRMQDNLDRFFGGGHDWNDVFGDRGRLDWTPAIETISSCALSFRECLARTSPSRLATRR